MKNLSLSNSVVKTLLSGFVVLFIGLSAPVLSASQDQDKSAIDTFIARQAQRERGEEYVDARQILAGDLNGDRAPETVVLYTIEGQGGSNNHVQYLAVFERNGGRLVAITYMPVGGKARRSMELRALENQRIKLATLEYGPKDAACCPSVKGATAYKMLGRRLREVKG